MPGARKVLMSALMLLLAGSAHADGLGDAKLAMAALDAGEYPKAVALFTRAISKGKLGRDDLELAYVKRARAYLGVKSNRAALTDLDSAEKLDPTDKEIADLRRLADGFQQGPFGCNEPIAPSSMNGAFVSRAQLATAIANVKSYIAESDIFQQCVGDSLASQKAQAISSNQTLDQSLIDAAYAAVSANQSRKQEAGDSINQAIADFKSVHP